MTNDVLDMQQTAAAAGENLGAEKIYIVADASYFGSNGARQCCRARDAYAEIFRGLAITWEVSNDKGSDALYALAAAFLIFWLWQHILDALPFLVVIACPLMHLFMHHGHGRCHIA
ncbi:DUF2933 domain-containing protein [Methylocystis sp. IM3]|uniref:DUF2933 domain-containing protein n=1 Tax=unclassified Methylocystis TaxID=2625913 RepID=UPI0030F9F818